MTSAHDHNTNNAMRPRRTLSIRAQLQLAMFLTAMVVVLAAVAIETAKHTRSLRAWAHQEATSVADAMAQDFLKLIVLGDPDGAANLVARVSSFPLIHGLVVYSDTGAPVFQFRRDMPDHDHDQEQASDDLFTIHRGITEQGHEYGHVELTISGERLRSSISDYYEYLVVLLIALIVVSVAAASYFQRFFTRPVLQLNQFMQRVAAERDFGLRIEPSRTDEFGAMYRGMNNLLAEMQRALRDKSQAESANKEKSAFLTNMSHELRTPLNAVIGYSEMLAEDFAADGNSSAVADLYKIRGAGHHLLALINDILDLSKIEAGKMQLTLSRFDLRSLVDDTLVFVQPLLARGENRLETHLDVDGVTLHSDPVRVRQVLFNLLSNACKFTRNGTITVAAHCDHATHPARVTFSVRDTGGGINPDELEQLFQPFVQAASVGKTHEGTGLGLALCRRFCTLMGGEIRAVSERGRGSEFSFWIPLDAQHASRASAA